jgi:hypothetical protein
MIFYAAIRNQDGTKNVLRVSDSEDYEEARRTITAQFMGCRTVLVSVKPHSSTVKEAK